MRKFLLLAISAVALIAISVPSASATLYTYSFDYIPDTVDYQCEMDVASQLTVTVSNEDVGADQVEFTFYNSADIQSSIEQIYFYDGIILDYDGVADLDVNSSDGVDFGTDNVTPPKLPGANNADALAVLDVEYGTDSEGGADGINTSDEWLSVVFSLIDGKTIDDLISEMALGEVVVGLHVQKITDGAGPYVNEDDNIVDDLSASYLSNLNPVPLPGAVWLVLTGLGVAGLHRKIRKS